MHVRLRCATGLDDAWQACGTGAGGSFHNASGYPLVNVTRFPDMKSMTDHAHALGQSTTAELNAKQRVSKWARHHNRVFVFSVEIVTPLPFMIHTGCCAGLKSGWYGNNCQPSAMLHQSKLRHNVDLRHVLLPAPIRVGDWGKTRIKSSTNQFNAHLFDT